MTGRALRILGIAIEAIKQATLMMIPARIKSL